MAKVQNGAQAAQAAPVASIMGKVLSQGIGLETRADGFAVVFHGAAPDMTKGNPEKRKAPAACWHIGNNGSPAVVKLADGSEWLFYGTLSRAVSTAVQKIEKDKARIAKVLADVDPAAVRALLAELGKDA